MGLPWSIKTWCAAPLWFQEGLVVCLANVVGPFLLICRVDCVMPLPLSQHQVTRSWGGDNSASLVLSWRSVNPQTSVPRLLPRATRPMSDQTGRAQTSANPPSRARPTVPSPTQAPWTCTPTLALWRTNSELGRRSFWAKELATWSTWLCRRNPHRLLAARQRWLDQKERQRSINMTSKGWPFGALWCWLPQPKIDELRDNLQSGSGERQSVSRSHRCVAMRSALLSCPGCCAVSI